MSTSVAGSASTALSGTHCSLAPQTCHCRPFHRGWSARQTASRFCLFRRKRSVPIQLLSCVVVLRLILYVRSWSPRSGTTFVQVCTRTATSGDSQASLCDAVAVLSLLRFPWICSVTVCCGFAGRCLFYLLRSLPGSSQFLRLFCLER
jgi:hypothetical protein